MSGQFNMEIKTLEALPEAAMALLRCFPHRRIFAFYGEMGAGKTTFIKAICEKLGTDETLSSPTYALVNEYTFYNGLIYHMDLYRLISIEEALNIGIEDYLANEKSYFFIEWPQLIETLLPLDVVKVYIETAVDGQRGVNAF
ncbi:tRNA (adenosine(37)-N6)-threonylcarbamoyltransferase complex ATPase subunit type 1 TsaE [soil metagenome]